MQLRRKDFPEGFLFGAATPGGVSRAESGAVHDPVRIDHINRHLAAMKQASDQGTSLKGFFCWSLRDNYERPLGYQKRFGRVHVDFETLQRTPKASYYALAQAIAR